MNLFAQSTKVRHRAVLKAAGVRITYSRGSKPVELDAIKASVRDRDLDEANISGRECDWIIWREDLRIDGAAVLPQRNDCVMSNGRKFQVLPRLGERCYRFTDQSEKQLRVFTIETPLK